MTTPSTLTSRNLRVAKPTLIERMVINDQAFVVTNPTLCHPGVAYRVELDTGMGIATINQIGSS